MRPLRFLITAGPTREPIDPVRFISNRSSGKMGYALAEAAAQAGHRVTLISGPVSLPQPKKVRTTRVETAEEMRKEVFRHARQSNVIIMAAAVADYRPVRTARQKIKKKLSHLVIRLKKNRDILLELGQQKKPHQLLVGFAAETSHLLKNARSKLKAKNLNLIIANPVGGKDSGFESNDNQITLLMRDGSYRAFPRMNKKKLAKRLIPILASKFLRPLDDTNG